MAQTREQQNPWQDFLYHLRDVIHVKNMLGKAVWVLPPCGKGKPLRGTVFAQGPGCIWWVMQKNGDVQCVPQGNLMAGERSQ